MTTTTPHILLVNPWIDDFAAYDVWAQPLGLFMLAGLLRRQGFRISYVDCLDRFHPRAPRTDPLARNGRGPYLKTTQPNPRGLEDIP
ncbi:MAG TPA: B12-binding domain-containing radical SAM protein, partial [Desulfosarcina sp.]|nr:B12-binding domain-containing radical SAM protein [Desulfosarcina sp.]